LINKGFSLICLLVFFTGCSSRKKDIVGLWRTDSISKYVNGFSFTNNTKDAHWSYFDYRADGTLFERRKGEYRKSRYRLVSADSLVYTDSTGKVLTGYKILDLNDNIMVLKMAQKPYLSGKNQELYEIRYFSKAVPKGK